MNENEFIKELEKYYFYIGEDENYYPKSSLLSLLRNCKEVLK